MNRLSGSKHGSNNSAAVWGEGGGGNVGETRNLIAGC